MQLGTIRECHYRDWYGPGFAKTTVAEALGVLGAWKVPSPLPIIRETPDCGLQLRPHMITSTSTARGTYPVQVMGAAGAVISSTTLSLVVQAAAPDFSFGPSSGSPTSQTITAGQTANFSLELTPSGAFSGTVNFSCAITPAVKPATTCNLPSSLQVSGTGSQSVSINVGTTATVTTSAFPDFRFPASGSRLLWIFGLLGTVMLLARRCNRILAFSLSVGILGTIFLLACGGSSSSSHTVQGTQAGTYTVTVTATSGSLNHNTVLQVVLH